MCISCISMHRVINCGLFGMFVVTVVVFHPPTSSFPRTDPASPFVTTSGHAGKRKFIAAVITTANGNSYDKLDSFLASWNATWPGLRFLVKFGMRNHEKLRGYGVLTAMASVMREVRYSRVDFDYWLALQKSLSIIFSSLKTQFANSAGLVAERH